MNDWIRGIKKGLPIAIGYLSVSFTFGVKAVNAGIPVWITILISVANVTSAGQFAGVAIMAAHGSYLEMAMTTFIINVRYMLMSFSLSQKVDKKMTLRQRLMIGYGITDEIFAVSSMETESLSPLGTDYADVEKFTMIGNKLLSLDLTVASYYVWYDGITSIDVSGCPALQTLKCDRGEKVKSLYLKKGQDIPHLTKNAATEIVYVD